MIGLSKSGKIGELEICYTLRESTDIIRYLSLFIRYIPAAPAPVEPRKDLLSDRTREDGCFRGLRVYMRRWATNAVDHCSGSQCAAIWVWLKAGYPK